MLLAPNGKPVAKERAAALATAVALRAAAQERTPIAATDETSSGVSPWLAAQRAELLR